jgi:hypothetical protein
MKLKIRSPIIWQLNCFSITTHNEGNLKVMNFFCPSVLMDTTYASRWTPMWSPTQNGCVMSISTTLVKIFVAIFEIGTYLRHICSAWNYFQMKRYYVSMCLLWFWNFGFIVKAIAHVNKKLCRIILRKNKVLYQSLQQTALAMVLDSAIYLDSILDKAIDVCFLLPRDTIIRASKN